MKKVALIGIGPHAKRIYLNYFKKHKINLRLVVELDSKKEETRNYLNETNFKTTDIFTIADEFKDNKHLPKEIWSNLLAVCKTLDITHIIIATEPKAHYMYLEFALKNNINVLTDKPIVVNKNMTSLKGIEETRKQYYELLELANNSKASCKVMCQRQYHRGYEEIKKVLADVVNEYQVPITYIDIFHSDGNWEMPHDLEKENHPYKYGYGKLFHSGYHFIDLLSDFLKINDVLDNSKRITKGDVYSKVFTPSDEMNCINFNDYKRIFKDQNIPDFYNNEVPSFKNYGEKNFHGLLSFYNRNGFTITTASLNLLHDGFSRRSWIDTKDFYKSNGRIRHERITIEIGHLLNIQVHSYQSKEIKDRTNDEESVGGLEHYDIYFFRNPLVDKEPFKVLHLGDMYSAKEKKEFLGYNELSREIFLTNFLNNKKCKGDIKDQALAIEILYSCSKELYNHYHNRKIVEPIKVRNNYTYPINLNNLKSCSKFVDTKLDKELINSNEIYKDDYRLSIRENYIKENNLYEVFVSIADDDDLVSGLLHKTFHNRLFSKIYYYHLKNLINKKSITKIIRKIAKV